MNYCMPLRACEAGLFINYKNMEYEVIQAYSLGMVILENEDGELFYPPTCDYDKDVEIV